jgi:glycosyltransferase involved in cell wall biosynthesis
VLPNGVDVDRYAPGPSQAARRFSADRLFTYLGRIDPEKNVDELLAAFTAAGVPNGLKLVVIGGGAEKRRLERRYRGARVVFTGPITDEAEKIDILRGSDGFFLPSDVEGLSLAMLEAMACGVATVATDVGSDGEALRGAGIVLNPGRLGEELGLAIRTLADVPALCRLLGGLARDRAVERYSLEKNLTGLIQLYEVLRARDPVRARV